MKAKQIISKLFATVAIVGVFVAVCTADDSAHEIACRLIGTATFIGGLVGWSLLTDKEAA
ncbi:MAG: hypothetical protein II001_05140 [Bacteroidales bacterium]|nr:hypothetical protein [Bacteroidales bacterium]